MIYIYIYCSRVSSVDAIVCVDACFTQKRRKNQGNAWVPPMQHPETVFVPPEDAEEMETFVDDVRPSRLKGKKTRSSGTENDAAGAGGSDYEPGLRVPTTVLDECNDSFVAADSNCVKASTLFFSDTGLMALLCRHDRVLWLVNMTSAGEKQHYVLLLLDKLFQHIPSTMRIGVLYDIGCQLHRSCIKHDFLSHARDRIIFGISVFHAYGHQWPCQIVYHPRKCAGFGLTDGEGCERFWSSIKSLIPSLRVSGYYNRIYTLDTQIKHLDGKSLLELGNWLKRKWIKMGKKKNAQKKILHSLWVAGISEIYLREQWSLQVAEQTKPLKKQSKDLANKEIRDILDLTKTLDMYREEMMEYQTILEGAENGGGPEGDVQTLLEEVHSRVLKTQKAILLKKSRLRVDGRLSLEKLLGNEFLRARMNALALKQRIRDRLRQRKFELENLERAYRKTVNHLKLEKHAQAQIKRKEPGIQALARKYNKLCGELSKMIAAGKTPRGAVAPPEIEQDGLFQLDVDDDIWQDIGLTDEVDDLHTIPDWLGNEDVRGGIKALLEHDRCIEEERRLIQERISMQQWIQEEWLIVITALDWEVDEDIIYQLNERKRHLLRLCVKWQDAVQIIPCHMETSWGPSHQDFLDAHEYEVEEQMIDGLQEEDEDEDEDEENGRVDELDEAELIANIELIALEEHYRNQ